MGSVPKLDVRVSECVCGCNSSSLHHCEEEESCKVIVVSDFFFRMELGFLYSSIVCMFVVFDLLCVVVRAREENMQEELAPNVCACVCFGIQFGV